MSSEPSQRPRRSWGVAATVAAVAVAIAVPTIALSARDDGSTDPGATSIDRHGPLMLSDLPTGPEPRHGYLAGTEFRNGAERVAFPVKPGTQVREFVAMTGGFLVSTQGDMGDERVRFIADDGTTSGSWPVMRDNFVPALAVSGDRALGALVKVNGEAVVVQDGGQTVTELPGPSGPYASSFAPISVSGSDCAGATPDCVVLVHGTGPIEDDGTLVGTWVARPHQPALASTGAIGEVRAAAANGYSAGTTRIIEDGDGSCAGVADTEGAVLWKTCKDRLISFSPDSSLVLASTSALFGSGDHELTILDAGTGDEVLRLETAENAGIYEMVWEDDDHVLAVVSDWTEDVRTGEHENQRWAVLRISLDGTREYAVSPVPGETEDYDGPLDLPGH